MHSNLRAQLVRLGPLLWYLATGTVITTVSQIITNKVKEDLQAQSAIMCVSVLLLCSISPKTLFKPLHGLSMLAL